MKRPCWLIGHKEYAMDSGYPVCICGTHSYWDYNEFYKTGLIHIPWKIWYNIANYIKSKFQYKFYRCGDCRKWEKLFGKSVGNHRDCMPF